MIIDVNGYHGTWPYWPTINSDPEAMLAKMDRYGIGRVFLSSLKAAFADVEGGNAEMLQVVRQRPDRFSPAFTYSPYAAGRERYREELLRERPCIVKLFPVSQAYEPAEEPFIVELLELAAAALRRAAHRRHRGAASPNGGHPERRQLRAGTPIRPGRDAPQPERLYRNVRHDGSAGD
jgi:hypothetical protein